MSVQNQKDPFRASFDAWPFSKETFDDVYVVSTTAFVTNDPHLWTPLLSPSARKDAFRRHANTCINCNGTGHSMRDCPEPCINTFSPMNPELQNNTQAWRRWQKRMREYRPPTRRGRPYSNNHNDSRSNRDRRHSTSTVSGSGNGDSSTRYHSSSHGQHQRTGPSYNNSNPNARNPGSFLTDRNDP